jgi:hypothetical protein
LSLGTDVKDRKLRLTLGVMIAAGATLTMLSFAMNVDAGQVKSKLQSLVLRTGPVVHSSEASR